MSRVIAILVAFLVGVATTTIVAFLMFPNMMIKEIQSPLPFEETLTQIEANAKELGWKVPNKWKANFQANFKKVVGFDIGPSKALKMCEPQAAVDILKHDRYKRLSVMMPCGVAVYMKNDGKTYISVMNMRLLGFIYGGEVAAAIDRVAPQVDKMLQLQDPQP